MASASVLAAATGLMLALGDRTSTSAATLPFSVAAPAVGATHRAVVPVVKPPPTTTPAPPPAVRSTVPVVASQTPMPPTPASVAEPSVGTLVAEVEATGVTPGSTWTWSIGDTATACGSIPGTSSGSATGCTFGAAGEARTVFSGTPTLALVAHELANAETENFAVPSLIAEVTTAEAGSSWSPIDATATCLVEHFMGFEDHAAGGWQCPADLATVVADNMGAS